MTIESTINRVRYIGNGVTTQFPFPFKVWKTNQVAVFTGDGSTELDSTRQCTIALSSSGGTVTFLNAPSSGEYIVIRRNMPFIQEDDYRNGTRFDSEEIEDRFDQDCAERQDLRLDVNRAIKTPITSDKTPEQYEKDFWTAYDDSVLKHAEVVQMHNYVKVKVPESLEAIEGAKTDALQNIDVAGRGALNSIESAKDNAIYIVEGVGAAEMQRLQNIAPIVLSDKGHSCQEVNWVLSSNISAGSTIDISPLVYVVGRHHVQVSCNGVVLYRTKQFDEVGVPDLDSSLIKINIDLVAGDTINVWIAGLSGTATHTTDGLLSAADKTKLDSLPSETSFSRVTTEVETTILEGSSFIVPEHAVGQGLLMVYHNGVLCEAGAQYTDETSTTIKFLYDVPAGDTITAAAVAVSAS